MKTAACFAYVPLALAVGVVFLAVAKAQQDESHQFAKELAALTPGERQQPAYYAPPPPDQPMLSGLTRRNAPGARLVVMANPDYFDPSLPRTAVQLIACEFKFQQAHDAGATAPLHRDLAVETLDRLLKQFEYQKLAGLIEGKR